MAQLFFSSTFAFEKLLVAKNLLLRHFFWGCLLIFCLLLFDQNVINHCSLAPYLYVPSFSTSFGSVIGSSEIRFLNAFF